MTTAVPNATAFTYSGDGVTRAFSFPLRFLETGELVVSVIAANGDETVQVIGTNYAVSGAGNPAGGTVTFNTGQAPAAGASVKISRRTQPKQTVDFEDLTRIPGDTVELQLDRLAMVLQELDQRFSEVETTPGPPGLNSYLFGDGAPTADIGSDGDVYHDRLAGELYKKASGSWVLQDNITGPQGVGAVWLFGSGAPGSGDGIDGDAYLDASSGDVYGKSGGSWALQGNIAGPAGAGTGDMLAAQNLNDVANKATAFTNIKQAATTSATGVVELATDAETIAGSDAARAVTPAGGAAAYEAKGKLAGIDTKTGNYTLALTDAGKLIEMNVASSNNLTAPPDSSVAFPVGARIDIAQLGTGQTTIVAGSGVTIRSDGGKLKLATRYSGATLIKRGTNEWYLIGNLTS